MNKNAVAGHKLPAAIGGKSIACRSMFYGRISVGSNNISILNFPKALYYPSWADSLLHLNTYPSPLLLAPMILEILVPESCGVELHAIGCGLHIWYIIREGYVGKVTDGGRGPRESWDGRRLVALERFLLEDFAFVKSRWSPSRSISSIRVWLCRQIVRPWRNRCWRRWGNRLGKYHIH